MNAEELWGNLAEVNEGTAMPRVPV